MSGITSKDLPGQPCCKRPDVFLMHMEPVNAVCRGCYQHWCGTPEMVCVYTKAQWEREMSA